MSDQPTPAETRARLASSEFEPVLKADGMRLLHGDCIDLLRTLPDDSVDAVVTDPPYGLAEHKPAVLVTALTAWANGDREQVPDGKGFMGKAWDAFVPPPAVWDDCLRVLKPGGHLVAFAGSRTYDLMGLSIRMAGFEIRDGLQWLYGSGFPKSKTQLKPSHEPIVLARKPFRGSEAANALTHGVGALNIEVCRVATADEVDEAGYRAKCASVVGLDSNRTGDAYGEWTGQRTDSASAEGRWPTNVLLDDTAATALDQQSGTLTSGLLSPHHDAKPSTNNSMSGPNMAGRIKGTFGGDTVGASRFFPTFRYQAKAPTRERPKVDGVAHPTVKPLALMQWLVRLVTPPGGVVLDPFAGSGTTLQAARDEGMQAIGIEREAAYLPLIAQRLGIELPSAVVS